MSVFVDLITCRPSAVVVLLQGHRSADRQKNLARTPYRPASSGVGGARRVMSRPPRLRMPYERGVVARSAADGVDQRVVHLADVRSWTS
jgi:hypothetical protein